jgi:dipeptidyl aminopeptidase/acylaminoacyl peptidase
LLRVSLRGTGKPRRLEIGSRATEDYFVDDKGAPIAIEEFDETDNFHRVIAIQEDERNVIYEEETTLKRRSITGLTPDRKKLVMLDTSDETGRTAYFTMSLSTGEIEGPFHDRDDADIVGVVMDIQRVVQGLQYSGLRPSYKFFDDGLDQRVKDIQAVFPDHSVTIADHSPDWKHILILMEGSQSSGEYYLFSDGQAPQYIAAQRPGISSADVNPIGTVNFSARDGLRIPSIITIPKNKVSDMTNLPAVVMPHGGPASYDQIGFDYEAQALAAQGYLVIMPQFRGSSGFGSQHKTAGYGEWGRKMQDDVSDAVKFFSEKGIIDASRVCIVGGSYGGYAALAGGAFSPELYKCVVSVNGIGDLERFHDWVRNEQGRSSEALAYWEMQIGKDDYSAQDARERSPEYSVERFSAPVLLIHSKADEVVPFSQSERMHEALQKAGKDVEFVELDGDDHYLSFGETRTKALQATVKFINENL